MASTNKDNSLGKKVTQREQYHNGHDRVVMKTRKFVHAQFVSLPSEREKVIRIITLLRVKCDPGLEGLFLEKKTDRSKVKAAGRDRGSNSI